MRNRPAQHATDILTGEGVSAVIDVSFNDTATLGVTRINYPLISFYNYRKSNIHDAMFSIRS